MTAVATGGVTVDMGGVAVDELAVFGGNAPGVGDTVVVMFGGDGDPWVVGAGGAPQSTADCLRAQVNDLEQRVAALEAKTV